MFMLVSSREAVGLARVAAEYGGPPKDAVPQTAFARKRQLKVTVRRSSGNVFSNDESALKWVHLANQMLSVPRGSGPLQDCRR
jgi:hypothetical protein